MQLNSIFTFLVAFVISAILFLLIFFSLQVYFFGIFDTTANISEFEAQEYWVLILQFSITIFFLVGISLIFGFSLKSRFIGSVLPLIIFLVISVYEYVNELPSNHFNKENWTASGDKQFLEAKGIVHSNSFLGKKKKEVLSILGEPTNSVDQAIFNYEIENLFNWNLSIHFDSCCVIKTELTKEPWNL